MPSRLIISLKGKPDDNPYQHARRLHQIVLEWVTKGLGDAVATSKLHDEQGVKPLSIAPLLSVSDGMVELRVSSLDDELMDAIRSGIRKSEPTITHDVGNRCYSFTLVDDGIDRIDISWNSLISRAQPATAWTIEALTPTVCRGHLGSEPDSVDIVVPHPALYFCSWLYRFQSFSPIQMPEEDVKAFIHDRLRITSFDGRTMEVAAGKRGQMITGYVGSIRFEVNRPKSSDREMLKALDTLASLAEFCGTGAHTMWGMGVTRKGAEKVKPGAAAFAGH
jgi:hypothetical protein